MRRLAGFLLISTFSAVASAVEVAGRTEAVWDVSANGAAQYSMPIRMTEGINGLTPRLAISYSGSERSILGVGFVLAGLSAISPCRKTLDQDGVTAAPTLSSGDRYCLNGARLRLTSGTWGASGSIYRTEVDQLARITGMESSAQNIPGWFKVETRDGLSYEYGRTADSKLIWGAPLFWAVNKISDRSGNSITFHFDTDQATHRFRPAYILYTASNQGAALYKISFVYQPFTRPDPFQDNTASNTGGAAHIETILLERIQLQHDGTTYREYLFTYEAGGGTNSRLKTVQECATTAVRAT